MRSPAVAMSVIVAFAAIAGHAQDGTAILDTAARALGATNLTSIPSPSVNHARENSVNRSNRPRPRADGRVRTLLRIDDWDFSWQESYDFKQFVRLPAGTRLGATIRYDNSAGNPRNPHVALQVVAVREKDLARLREAYAAHVRDAAIMRPGLNQLLER